MAREGRNPYLIAEMDQTVFVVGDHQFYEGYSLVLVKEHVRELHELTPAVQAEQFADVMRATRALSAAFSPWKMNHACYGNTVPHVHWHVFPRYADDPDRDRHPWLHVDRFREREITAEEAQKIAARIRPHLS